jgi:hypothetical protein
MAALIVLIGVLSGCTGGGGGGGSDPAAACRDVFAQVAAMDPANATPTDLDLAIRRCRSLGDWAAAAASYPETLAGADPMAYLETRCAATDSGLSGYALCGLLRVASATATPSPTRRPTPRPTEGPPRSVAMWDTYRRHFYGVEAKGVNLVYDAIDGLERSTIRSVRPAVEPLEKLRRWAIRELGWLGRHRAHRCYAPVQAAWTRGVELVAQGTRLAVPGLKRRDPGRLMRAGDTLVKAGEWFQRSEKRFQKLGPGGCD